MAIPVNFRWNFFGQKLLTSMRTTTFVLGHFCLNVKGHELYASWLFEIPWGAYKKKLRNSERWSGDKEPTNNESLIYSSSQSQSFTRHGHEQREDGRDWHKQFAGRQTIELLCSMQNCAKFGWTGSSSRFEKCDSHTWGVVNEVALKPSYSWHGTRH